jgi:protein MAK16
MSDEIVWQIINHGFCSFKSTTRTQNFCRNKYNVTGLCLKSACPLANSKYATIIEKNGICYLYIKVPERAHLPNRMWDKIKLPANYVQALNIVAEKLEYFPKYLQHRTKQRLTKIHQYLIRMRKLALNKDSMPILTRVNKKEERQESRKEARAEKIAEVERSIEKELLERLRQGTYGDIYNFPLKQFEKVLEGEEVDEREVEREGDNNGDEFVDAEELGSDEGSSLFDDDEDDDDFDDDDEELLRGRDVVDIEDMGAFAAGHANDSDDDEIARDSEDDEVQPPKKTRATSSGKKVPVKSSKEPAPSKATSSKRIPAKAFSKRKGSSKKGGNMEMEYEVEREQSYN